MKKMKWLLIICLLLCGCGTKTYQVKIKDDKGKLLSSISVKEGKPITKIEEPTVDGYLFVTWLKDGEEYDLNKPVYENIELTPQYVEIPKKEIKYKVIFNFGDKKKTKTIKKGNTVEKPTTDPERKGYKFMGWYLNNELYDFNQKVESDLELIAMYKPINVTISFDLLGGGGVKQITINMGSKLPKVKNPTKRGYKFKGWLFNNQNYDPNYIINEDISLVANWEKISYVKVIFDTDGGTKVADKILEKGEKLGSIENPTKEGYDFQGWFLNNQAFNSNSKVNEDIILKAKFVKIQN